ncbi:MAG: tetratricopeptide repeat protein [Pseudomonadota bacterium]
MKNGARLAIIGGVMTALTLGWGFATGRLGQQGLVGDQESQGYIAMFDVPTRPTVSGNYLSGRVAQRNGDWDTAAKRFDWLADAAGMPTDMAQRAMVLSMGAGQPDRAVALAETIIKQKKMDLADLILAMDAVKKNDLDLARKRLSGPSESGLGQNVKPVLLAWLSLPDKSKAPTPALPVLKPTNPLAFYHAILISDAFGRKDELARLPADAVIRAGFIGKTLERLGDAYLRHGLFNQAGLIYAHLLIDAPQDKQLIAKRDAAKTGIVPADLSLVAPIATPTEGIVKTNADMAALLFQEGAMDSARLFAQIAAYLDPTGAESHIILANISVSDNRLPDAIKQLEAIKPHDKAAEHSIIRQIAELNIEIKDPASALQSLSTLAKEHNDVQAQMQIGDIHRNQENFAPALDAYNAAFKMLGDKVGAQHWELFYARGMVQERLKNYKEADADLEKALSYQPNHPYILNYLGYSWADRGKNLDKALAMISRAVRLQPDDGYITDSLGWIYYRMGEYPKAVPVLEDAVALMPYDPVINDHLGDAYWQVGRKSEARFQWQRALNAAMEDDISDDADLRAQLSDKLENGPKPADKKS